MNKARPALRGSLPASPAGSRSAAARVVVTLGLLSVGWVAWAQQPPSPSPSAPPPRAPSNLDSLATSQAQIADKYARLEQLLIRMAELEATTHPQRAALLKQAAQQSSERLTRQQLAALTKLLAPPARLKEAIDEQQQVIGDLQALLTLLQSENRADRLKNEQARIKDYLKEVDRLIRLQQGIQGRTEGGDDRQRLAADQGNAADRSAKLAQQIQETEESKSGRQAASKDQEGKTPDSGQPSESAKDAGSTPPQGQSGKQGQSPKSSPSPDKNAPGKKSDDEKGAGEKSAGDKSAGDKSAGDKSAGDKSAGDKSAAEKSAAEKVKADPAGPEKAEGSKSSGEPSSESKSAGKKSDSKSPSGKAESSGKQKSSAPPSGEPGEPGSSAESPSAPEQKEQEGNPARQRVQAAEQRMREAQKKIADAQQKEAIAEQEKAREELEQARAELERLLRQMREEERERTLALLEGRFRQMLEAQLKIYEGTKRLDKTPVAERTRDLDIQASKLGFEEGKLAIEADKALLLLREEGSSVAFPETVEMVRDDMQQVSTRLAAAQVDQVTQGIQEEIIQSLEELVAAMQKAQQDLKDKKPMPPSPQEPQDPSAKPLVDQLTELKMIRSLQLRVNTRTQRYSKLLANADDPVGRANDADLRRSLQQLSDLQKRIQEITRNVVLGKNK